jgi:hypothetical protein
VSSSSVAVVYYFDLFFSRSITTLRDLALELDEGLGEHVEEFARELHIESFDGEESSGRSPGNSSKFDECEEEDEEEDLDDDLLEEDGDEEDFSATRA